MKRLKGYLLWCLIILLILVFACTKKQTEGQCLIISFKYTREKVFIRTDTPYNDYLTGYWFEVFVEDKRRWDRDTGFVVCGRDLFEKIIYVVK